jgi:hypothetical protein
LQGISSTQPERAVPTFAYASLAFGRDRPLLHVGETRVELWHRRIYLTGTISTDRSGYAKDLVTLKSYETVNKKKILVPPQGTIKIAESKRFPQITAALWMYRNPVHLLSSGGSRQTGTVSKYIMREQLQETVANSDGVAVCVAVHRVDGEMQAVPSPELVRDYHRWMGGVNVHAQLRMQRYSVQLCYKTRKYYKTLFLGLLDMALVNAFIVFCHHRKVNNKRLRLLRDADGSAPSD